MIIRPFGVHISHCCVLHGCKYGDENCPVKTREVAQEYTCERCSVDGIKTVDEAVRQSKLKKPGSMKIEISVEPDEEKEKEGTPYSWCLMKYNDFIEPCWDYSEWTVVASGWSSSQPQAYQDACEALQKHKQGK